MRRLLSVTWALALAVALSACRQNIALDLGNDGGGTGGNAGNAGNAGDAGFANCPPIGSAIQYPSVIVALDRSMAMLTQFANGGDQRLLSAQDEISKLANTFQAIVRLGYVEFPAPDPSCQSSGGCCAGDPTFPKTFNQNPIFFAMHLCDSVPGGCMSPQRPIADALSQCRQTYSQLVNDGHNRYVILVTADDPACSGGGSPCSDAQGQVVNLVNNDVTTYVVGMGSDLSSTICLDKLASYGRAARTSGPPFYYPARSSSDLRTTLDSIARTIAADACDIALDPVQFDPSKVQVLMNGAPIPSNGPDGWDFAPRNDLVIQLHGAACDSLVQSTQTPDVQVVTCPSKNH